MSVERIVCLVPSLTETLGDFGLMGRLVGRTRYCTEPQNLIESVPEVGGTKNPDIKGILDLEPDLVVMNAEENRLEDYQALSAAGLNVYVTHPRTVAEAAQMLAELGRVSGAASAGRSLENACMAALAQVREDSARRPSMRVFCPIWRNPWMTFHRDTYVGSVLRTVGFDNVFSDRLDTGSDFFTVELDEVVEKAPHMVLLPDEPYVFTAEHGRELAAEGVGARYEPIDGKDLSWYGPRLPGALRRLAALSL